MQRTLFKYALRAQTPQVARISALNAIKTASPLAATKSANHAIFAKRFYSAETKAEETKEQAEQASESAEGESLDSIKQQLAQMQEKLSKKDKECAEFKDRYLRSVADFRNLQETTKREVQKAKNFGLQKFAKDLLETVDNFGHALNAVKQETLESNKEIKDLYDGMQMTQNVFEKTLTRYGITKVDPLGEKFDPNIHEATFEVPQPDKESGTVFHVQQPGYSLNNRVLRAAKVGVVKGSD